jgi:hypothetical protein
MEYTGIPRRRINWLRARVAYGLKQPFQFTRLRLGLKLLGLGPASAVAAGGAETGCS